jgi:hypothetical protein
MSEGHDMHASMTKEDAYARLVADAVRLGAPPFEPNAMADALMAELTAKRHEMPESTQALLMQCVVTLKKHHADGVISEHRAREMVKRLQGGEGPKS